MLELNLKKKDIHIYRLVIAKKMQTKKIKKVKFTCYIFNFSLPSILYSHQRHDFVILTPIIYNSNAFLRGHGIESLRQWNLFTSSSSKMKNISKVAKALRSRIHSPRGVGMSSCLTDPITPSLSSRPILAYARTSILTAHHAKDNAS